MGISDEKVGSVPVSAGVYILKDRKGRSLYIGKAKNLRSRVMSYLHEGGDPQRPHISYLMREVEDLDYFVTRNEREALVLENSLIKQKKPRYNIRLRDDKNYLSLRLDPRERFPRLTLTRRVLKDGALYYGPFASADALKKAKRLIHKVFPLRDCTDEKFRRHSARPCLSYYMGMCLGPCAGKVGEDEYGEAVERTRMFLRGEKNSIIEMLRNSMRKASEEMRYEDAAHYRDQARLLEKNLDEQMFITPGTKDRDIVGFHREGQDAEFSVLFSRGGMLVDKAEYSFKNAAGTDEDLLGEFISQFYGGNRFIPNEIIIPIGVEGIEDVSEWLSERLGRKVALSVPERGVKASQLELAGRNALESFQRKHARELSELDILERLKSSLHLSRQPAAIECFDISNIQGELAVASLVRFEGGKPARERYRTYKIKTVEGPNDYAMMREVLSRRLTRAEEEVWGIPDLILIDGGKGQLNIAHSVIEELGYTGELDLASIAKGRYEGESDKMYIYGRKNPIVFSRNSQVLFLLMRVRDEAHRFAITFHKKLRGKRAVSSALDDVPGIGAKRKKELIKRFGSLSGIKAASVDEIAAVPGLSRRIAEELKEKLSD
ncbi:MAG TPA: excinuclease ABC subunit UvrC [Thermodesulfobacteriota bacterium]|nr:excinuclease ABC subunit UvrC [Thermodesulfobacteriota bacterium]